MSTIKRDAKTSRREILAAAAKVIVRDGYLSLTLDAVAAEAGLSKGGVLYHFASKDALVRGMLEFCIEEFRAQIELAATNDPEPHGRWLRAFLRSLVNDNGAEADSIAAGLGPSELRRLHVAFVAAVTVNPELYSSLKVLAESVRGAIEHDGLPLDEARSIWAAGDGLWFWQAIGFPAVDDDERRRVVESLIARTLPTRERKGAR